MSIFYTKKFYDRDYIRTSKSARAIVPYVMDIFQRSGVSLASVIDVGCGRGVWLKQWKEQGVGKVKGRDGQWVTNDQLLVDHKDFEVTDLSQNFREDGKFDLAMTLEVAEHIDECNADIFVENMVELSDTIMFSAAIAGQGGQHHVNERPISYWIAKFAKHGFVAYDPIRPRFWGNDEVCWWYRQNIIILCRANSSMCQNWQNECDSAPHIFDISHPTGFYEKAKLANLFSPEEYIGIYIAKLKKYLNIH